MSASPTPSAPTHTPSKESAAAPAQKVRKTLTELLAAFFGQAKSPEHLKLIENRTAWRIVIRANTARAALSSQLKEDGHLLLSPFGKRVLQADALEQFDYQPWEARNFIRTEDYVRSRPTPPFGTVIRIAAWLTLILTLLAFPAVWVKLAYWEALVAILVAVFLVERQPIFQWITEAVNLMVIFLISLGLAVGFYELFTEGQQTTNVTLRAGIGVVFFVVVASSLPALLYYLFERQKSDTLREFFLRDVIRLNPNIHTVDEADFRYGKLVEEVYGRKSSQDFLGGLQVSLLVNLGLTTLGWSLALMPNLTLVHAGDTPYDAIPKLIIPLAHPVIYGALGSYFFALNMLFRRYVRADLSAKAYTHVAVRQLLTVTLVWVISSPTHLWNTLGGIGQETLLAFSFLVGIVPETALALLQDYLRNQKVLTDRIPSLREDQPLDDLEGVSLYDRARLLEEGIENIENLAHHNLLDLMLRTRLPTSRLTDLVDQAILYLHLYETPSANGAAAAGTALTTLRHYGIRTATDLEHARDLAQARSAAELQTFLSLLGKPDDKSQRLQVVLDTLEDDDWMAYLREWHRNQRTENALSLEEIEAQLSQPEAYAGSTPSQAVSPESPPTSSPPPVVEAPVSATEVNTPSTAS